MKKSKDVYVAPQIEVIEMENEGGVMNYSSGGSGVPGRRASLSDEALNTGLNELGNIVKNV